MSTLTRREFLEVAGALAALGGLAASSRGAILPTGAWRSLAATMGALDTTYFDWKNPVPGVHVGQGEGGNTLVLVGKTEALLIDTKNCGFGKGLRREAESFGVPVRLVINTHHHADHTGGNPAFSVDVPLLAHPKAAERIGDEKQYANYRAGATNTLKTLGKSDKPAAKQFLADAEALVKDFPKGTGFVPTKTFEPKDGRQELTAAGERIEISHVGPGHTDNDLIVRIPGKNVVHTGDLVFNKMWPYMDRAGGCDSAGWLRSLEKLATMCDDKTVVVPGHGDVSDKSCIGAQAAFFKDMRARAAEAFKKGMTREEFVKLTPEEYKDYAAGDRIRPITLGGLYDEAAGTPVK